MAEKEVESNLISETESFVVWRTQDDAEGYYYHIALGAVTLHLTSEEWNEFALLIKGADV